MPTTDLPPAVPVTVDNGISIIGGGPAGLMAAEAAATQGCAVELYDAMPSVGRKFLLAGKSGLNLTHAEAREAFLTRYGERQAALAPFLHHFDNQAVRDFAATLGVETFVGSSGRVFPRQKKAAPLLRAWLRRLRELGVRIHVRHRWQGWEADGRLRFATPDGILRVRSAACVLALGGGSWSRLGSDGAWQAWLRARDVAVRPLRPANCGFDIGWRPDFAARFAGTPVKPVAATLTTPGGESLSRRGEFVITRRGVEGSLIYALAAPLRDLVEQEGKASLYLDLAPDLDPDRLRAALNRPRGARSLSQHLQRVAGLSPVKLGLLRERLDKAAFLDPDRLGAAIRALPLRLDATRPLEEAISSAGGVAFAALDEQLMIRHLPGVFCAGEMLDWEAPTGGYLLTACLATGLAAGQGAARWLRSPAREHPAGVPATPPFP